MRSDRKNAYICGKINSSEAGVIALKARLEGIGWQFSYDWTKHPIAKPFSEHRVEAQEAAWAMLSAIQEADLVVLLLNDPRLMGAYMEVGGAILLSAMGAEKTIVVVGEVEDTSRSIFFQFGFVHCFEQTEEAFRYIADLDSL